MVWAVCSGGEMHSSGASRRNSCLSLIREDKQLEPLIVPTVSFSKEDGGTCGKSIGLNESMVTFGRDLNSNGR